ncbi:hypothetical protein INR49_018517, partial [Caranx melampygus]
MEFECWDQQSEVHVVVCATGVDAQLIQVHVHHTLPHPAREEEHTCLSPALTEYHLTLNLLIQKPSQMTMHFLNNSIEKMKSLAVWISNARWSSYSRWSCLLNSWMSRLRSSMRAADLKSSSGPAPPPCGSLLAAIVGLFPRLPAEPVRPERAGAAIFPP